MSASYMYRMVEKLWRCITLFAHFVWSPVLCLQPTHPSLQQYVVFKQEFSKQKKILSQFSASVSTVFGQAVSGILWGQIYTVYLDPVHRLSSSTDGMHLKRKKKTLQCLQCLFHKWAQKLLPSYSQSVFPNVCRKSCCCGHYLILFQIFLPVGWKQA